MNLPHDKLHSGTMCTKLLSGKRPYNSTTIKSAASKYEWTNARINRFTFSPHNNGCLYATMIPIGERTHVRNAIKTSWSARLLWFWSCGFAKEYANRNLRLRRLRDCIGYNKQVEIAADCEEFHAFLWYTASNRRFWEPATENKTELKWMI